MMASNDGIDVQWLVRLLKKSHHDSKPEDVNGVEFESAVQKGENYSSTITRVKMKTISASGKKKKISVIIKTYTMPEAAATLMKEFRQFHNETKMFRIIFPLMEDLMEEFGDKRSTLWPKMFGYIVNHQVVFEDLKESNFILVDRKGWQGLDHAVLVLRSLGRFHAMGKTLLARDLIDKENRGCYFLARNSVLQRRVLEGCIHMLSQAMIHKKGYWPSGWEKMGMRVANQIPTIGNKMEMLYQSSDEAFHVLNHGDLWSSNMMFQVMEYTNIPVTVKFVDYQMPHINSFIWDINHFIYTSVQPSVRRANKNHLLAAYHTSLSDNMKFFGYEGYIPTLEDVTSELDRTLTAGFALVASILPMASGTATQPFQLDKLDTSPPEEAFDETIFSELKYVQEICEDLQFFADKLVI